jgi:hypothetical protein
LTGYVNSRSLLRPGAFICIDDFQLYGSSDAQKHSEDFAASIAVGIPLRAPAFVALVPPFLEGES